LLAEGQKGKAIEVLRSAPEGTGGDAVRLLAALGQAQLSAGQQASAVETFERLARVAPGSVAAQVWLARVYTATGDAQGARRALDAALAIDPNHLPSAVARARLAFVQRDYDRAKRLTAELREKHPESPTVQDLEGDLAVRDGRLQDAEQAYRAALAKWPNPKTAVSLAQVQFRAGRTDEGLATLEAWLKNHPEDVSIHTSLAAVYEGIGRPEDAIKAYQQVLERAPSSVVAHNNLALLLRAGDPKSAVRYAEQAYALAPQDPGVMDTLAVLLLDKNEPRRALDLLEKAGRLAPTSSAIALHRATALTQTGETAAARQALTELLAREGDFAERAEAANLLRSLP
jgi:putative PEP-CTERM system TPR-repeat lipoprotein